MFSSGPNYTKLKTNLRLAVNRLKLLEKKKTELAQKSRREIVEYIQGGKYERAKIRVECIIREDYLVEAMELVEMYCDLLLARFGLITQMKVLDEGLAEAVSSVLWVAPRLQVDVEELKIIADLLTTKYGKPYTDACRAGQVATISEKLKHKMSVHSPPKLLVEKYMIEIAKNYNIEYSPDPQVMKDDLTSEGVDALLDINDRNNLGGGGGGVGGGGGIPAPAGFIGYPQPPLLPAMPDLPNVVPFNYPPITDMHRPPPGGSSGGGFVSPSAPSTNHPYGAPFSYNIPPSEEKKDLNTNFLDDDISSLPTYSMVSNDDNSQNMNSNIPSKPQPQPRTKIPGDSDIPQLPNVPSDLSLPSVPNDDIDFDDLTRRFEELKKKK